uniref:Uncharacterized protein n=1 Tax=Chromera velia CCMP2878 TaxID=1169474 RepID=A0A0G4F4K6_9ALVE|eukprot:Cvel_15095.t1-p1 / transcript=Cvel_15095.t1 / gene=Cvel_15095 / organism=Chromera_velia_CCMP2878 / gene_product=Protein DDB_G0276689, putative / transcript_product=Protein DDB_G0276689, putative / location=Cvel_scaffold1101:29430-31619(+) / protein_length=730 / sequence_SO=supercontig / SO=protein_coding / is_pseudo=false
MPARTEDPFEGARCKFLLKRDLDRILTVLCNYLALGQFELARALLLQIAKRSFETAVRILSVILWYGPPPTFLCSVSVPSSAHLQWLCYIEYCSLLEDRQETEDALPSWLVKRLEFDVLLAQALLDCAAHGTVCLTADVASELRLYHATLVDALCTSTATDGEDTVHPSPSPPAYPDFPPGFAGMGLQGYSSGPPKQWTIPALRLLPVPGLPLPVSMCLLPGQSVRGVSSAGAETDREREREREGDPWGTSGFGLLHLSSRAVHQLSALVNSQPLLGHALCAALVPSVNSVMSYSNSESSTRGPPDLFSLHGEDETGSKNKNKRRETGERDQRGTGKLGGDGLTRPVHANADPSTLRYAAHLASSRRSARMEMGKARALADGGGIASQVQPQTALSLLLASTLEQMHVALVASSLTHSLSLSLSAPPHLPPFPLQLQRHKLGGMRKGSAVVWRYLSFLNLRKAALPIFLGAGLGPLHQALPPILQFPPDPSDHQQQQSKDRDRGGMQTEHKEHLQLQCSLPILELLAVLALLFDDSQGQGAVGGSRTLLQGGPGSMHAHGGSGPGAGGAMSNRALFHSLTQRLAVLTGAHSTRHEALLSRLAQATAAGGPEEERERPGEGGRGHFQGGDGPPIYGNSASPSPPGTVPGGVPVGPPGLGGRGRSGRETGEESFGDGSLLGWLLGGKRDGLQYGEGGETGTGSSGLVVTPDSAREIMGTLVTALQKPSARPR